MQNPKVGDFIKIDIDALMAPTDIFRRLSREYILAMQAARIMQGIYHDDAGELFTDVPLERLSVLEIEKLENKILVVTDLKPDWPSSYPKPSFLREAKDPTTGEAYLFRVNCVTIVSSIK